MIDEVGRRAVMGWSWAGRELVMVWEGPKSRKTLGAGAVSVAEPRASRGIVGASSGHQESEEIEESGGIVRVTARVPYDRHDWLSNRILTLIGTGEKWGDRWQYEPGCMAWHAVRTGVGGRVR